MIHNTINDTIQFNPWDDLWYNFDFQDNEYKRDGKM